MKSDYPPELICLAAVLQEMPRFVNDLRFTKFMYRAISTDTGKPSINEIQDLRNQTPISIIEAMETLWKQPKVVISLSAMRAIGVEFID